MKSYIPYEPRKVVLSLIVVGGLVIYHLKEMAYNTPFS